MRLSRKQWLRLLMVCIGIIIAVAGVWRVRQMLTFRIIYHPLSPAEKKVVSAVSIDGALRYQLQAPPGALMQASLEHYHYGELMRCHDLGRMTVPKRQSMLYVMWRESFFNRVEEWILVLGEQQQITEVPQPERFSCSASKIGNGAQLQFETPQVLYARSMGWERAEGFGDGVFTGVIEDWQMLMSTEDAFVLRVVLLQDEER